MRSVPICQMCRFYVCCVQSLYSHNNTDSAATDLRNGFSTKFWVSWDGGGVVVLVYLWLSNWRRTGGGGMRDGGSA